MAAPFFEEADREESPPTARHLQDETKRARHQPIVCAACKHPITHAREACQEGGKHAHTCMNPEGYFYRVGCYEKAPGCQFVGPPDPRWSWFDGYAWQVAVCGGCREHLGWRFTNEARTFFGLITDRLETSRD